MKKSNLACVYIGNLSQYDSGERCGPWVFFFSLLTDIRLKFGTLPFHIKIQIKFKLGFNPLIFPEVMTLGLRKIPQIISNPHFFSLLTDIHLIFSTMLCHIKLQIKFEFGFDL
jgi:hypothetical protein